MNLELLLNPVDIDSLKLQLKDDSIFHSIFIFSEKMPSWKATDIAIIGVNEYRGREVEMFANAADKVRKKLYELKQFKNSIKISDLGNLKLGETLEQTQDRLAEICKNCVQNKVIPIIIGGSHDLDLGQFKSYQVIEEDLKVFELDSSVNVYETGLPHETHIREMLLHEPNILFNLTHAGHQGYLVHPHAVDTLEKMNCDHVRLGEISNDIKKLEPYIRFAQMVSFDMEAVKQSDFNCSFNPQPFGITAEQICQLSWYAGMSNECNTFGVYGYYPELDGRLQGAGVIAVMIWYFIDGFYHRPKLIYTSDDYRKYTVLLDKREIIFYKDIERDMWWAELEIDKSKMMVPCSYEEYIQATKHDFPQRLYDLEMKFM